MYYSIDDEHGTNICGGIQLEHKARETAQEYADDLNAPVRIYSNEPGDEGAIVHPSRKTRIESLTLSQIEQLNHEATSAGDDELAANCALLAAAVHDSGTVDVEYAIESSELRSAELLECARIIVAAINDAESQA